MASDSLSRALLSSGGLDHCNDPVDLLLVEHHRQRAILNRIIRTIEAREVEVAHVAAVMRPLTAGAILHRADEEDSLFPLLFQRKRREDNIEPLIRQLLDEHGVMEDAATTVAAQLTACLHEGRMQLPMALRAELLRLTFLVETHLALENGILLPIAHQRLTLRDRLSIGHDFKSRRTHTPIHLCPYLADRGLSLVRH